ncbi:hypothetical protein GCM10027091_34050 [Streptomyces daliensis]
MADPSPLRRTGESPSLPAHPGLTFKIYRVNPHTLERGPATLVRAKPSKAPLASQTFPPCRCGSPRCPDREGAR